MSNGPISRVTAVEVHGIRFPTSEQRDGSDAMNPGSLAACWYPDGAVRGSRGIRRGRQPGTGPQHGGEGSR
ncbi:hypothetical protein ACQEU8_24300 [Streptomyces sp. CA-250714]|uniref:hypothetical protein n=1 Tax=Streptomyces sp. CA-250714 TaxID=3240060 RepID=UPI003D94D19A